MRAPQEAIGASARVFELMDRVPKIPLRGGAKPPEAELEGPIEFVRVTFAYPTRLGSPVLRNLNLTFDANKTTAVVGPSGGGKSTLFSLLLRFYDPTAGSVRIGSWDLERLDPAYARHRMAIVAQEPALFAASVRENVLYGWIARHEGEPLPSDAAVWAAVRAANAGDFIAAFPEGLGTLVGERGVRLSGGQVTAHNSKLSFVGAES